jgi:VanZ family protein
MKPSIQWKYYVPALVWFGVIFRLCTMPGIDLPDLGLFEPDKIAHAGIHFLLVSFAAWGAYKNRVSLKKINLILLYFAVGSMFYGMSLEFIQETFFPGRTFDWFDALANSVGAFVGMLVARRWYQIKSRQFE